MDTVASTMFLIGAAIVAVVASFSIVRTLWQVRKAKKELRDLDDLD
jgi:ABC-type nickel/cobalt efflux system permease component RcnA